MTSGGGKKIKEMRHPESLIVLSDSSRPESKTKEKAEEITSGSLV